MSKNSLCVLAVASLGLGVLGSICVPNARAKDEPAGVPTNALAEADVAFLKKGLAKKPKDGELNTLKATAMMLALYAQANTSGPDAAKAAGQRDQALLIAAAITKKDFTAAKTALDGLTTAKDGDPKKVVKLHEQHAFDLSELMAQFSLGRSGGRHIEADLKAQAAKLTDVKLAGELGARVATIGQYAALMPSTEAVGAKKKKWDDLCTEMVKLGADAATEGAKGDKADKPALAKKLAAINLNCKSCHDAFKNN